MTSFRFCPSSTDALRDLVGPAEQLSDSGVLRFDQASRKDRVHAQGWCGPTTVVDVDSTTLTIRGSLAGIVDVCRLEQNGGAGWTVQVDGALSISMVGGRLLCFDGFGHDAETMCRRVDIGEVVDDRQVT